MNMACISGGLMASALLPLDMNTPERYVPDTMLVRARVGFA
jgi:hypothetical protein